MTEKLNTKSQPKNWGKMKSPLGLLVLFMGILVGFLWFFDTEFTFWDFFNRNAGAVQGISTIVLVVVTSFYALQMYKTNSLISMQIFPNIFLKPGNLKSSLLNPETVEKVQRCVSNGHAHTMYNMHFDFSYSAVNHSASSGTFEKPRLLIENPKTGKNKILLLGSKRTSRGFFKTGDSASEYLAAMKVWEAGGEITNTIYLRPGETKNMEETLLFSISCDKPTDVDIDFINNAEQLQYTILYKNVVGDEFSIILTKESILPLKN